MAVWKEQHEDEVVLGLQPELFPGLNHVSIDMRLSIKQWGLFLEKYSHVLQHLNSITFKFDVPTEIAERIWRSDPRLYKKREEYGWDVRNADVLCYELYKPALNKHGWLDKRNRKWKFWDLSSDYGIYWRADLDLRW